MGNKNMATVESTGTSCELRVEYENMKSLVRYFFSSLPKEKIKATED